MNLIERPIQGKFVPMPDQWKVVNMDPTILVMEGPLPDARSGAYTDRRGKITFRTAPSGAMAWMCSKVLWYTCKNTRPSYVTAQCRANTVLREILQGEM